MVHSIDKASKGIWKCYIGSIPILGVSVVQVHISDLLDVAVSLYEVQILSPLIEKVKWYRISIYLWFWSWLSAVRFRYKESGWVIPRYAGVIGIPC